LQHKNIAPSLLNSDKGTVKNQLESAQESMGDFTLLLPCFAKKSLTKTDLCAGALSRRGNQLLVLHFSGRLFLNATVKQRRISIYISLATAEFV
jgi:hypothetical protein